MPAEQQDQGLGVLAGAGLHHPVDALEAVEDEVGPDLQLEGGHLVAAGFQLLFVLVDLEAGDLVDHVVEGLVHLGELGVAVVHVRPGRQLSAADPVHGADQQPHRAEDLLPHIGQQEGNGGDHKDRRQNQQHLIAAEGQPPVLIGEYIVQLQHLGGPPHHQPGLVPMAGHAVALRVPADGPRQGGLVPQQQPAAAVRAAGVDQGLALQPVAGQQLFKDGLQVDGRGTSRWRC